MLSKPGLLDLNSVTSVLNTFFSFSVAFEKSTMGKLHGNGVVVISSDTPDASEELHAHWLL